ncbi:MAG: DUF4446 family protein [Candidatus Pacebacteria bacterium]|jgi:hypothetical protein|nr:DUF4446 family protein [Candidatus Paceibacterota bacterium]MDP7159490.1 DUF4446 family protein [Candidatus Paceibacterota bacterium]MDP7367343.1 DUF4446 family protein [Candidatus Paceibacterota bacterium]MDP7466137.1 DUF4446 family protein [Candidatus Paceibacterota bacterium]MDP7648165.1 DUF4446 family protein [Candidatus Paceibacterota bacterium]|tara:strand:- start:94 stop:573 length:480 start_codon:yes stop_codon:yes gene_type:complete
MQFDISSIPIYMIYALGGVLIFLVVWIIGLERKVKKFTYGKNGKSLEDSIMTIKGDLNDLEKFRKDMEEYLTQVEKRLRRSTQGIETIRFNPFKGAGQGGNQSFATAFLDENGDGLVISSLYARERVSIFSKPIKKYVSEFELSEEEKKAIDSAKKKLK